MLKPTALPCGHSGCQECLAKLLALQPNPKCPLCKKCIPSIEPLNINYILHDITSKLQVYCTNEGCHWTGTYDGTEHHANRCERVRVECENNGCTDVLQRGDMASHLLECPKQEMRCMDREAKALPEKVVTATSPSPVHTGGSIVHSGAKWPCHSE